MCRGLGESFLASGVLCSPGRGVHHIERTQEQPYQHLEFLLFRGFTIICCLIQFRSWACPSLAHPAVSCRETISDCFRIFSGMGSSISIWIVDGAKQSTVMIAGCMAVGAGWKPISTGRTGLGLAWEQLSHEDLTVFDTST